MANTALATAGNLPVMASAFRQAIEAGRKAYLAGLGEIRIHIGHDYKAFFGKNLGGLNGFLIVGKQVLRVPHDLNLDKISAAKFTGKPGNPDGFFRSPCAAGIGEQRNALG